MSRPLKKYKKELKYFFINLPTNKHKVLDHLIMTIDEYPNVDTLSYDELIDKFGEPESIYYQYINDNDLYSPVQKHKNKHKSIIIFLIILFITCLFLSFIYFKYEANKSYINREEIEIIQE